MQPATVLAGPIQFSPAEIAFFFLVITLAALAVSAPGWVVLGEAARRRAAARGAQRRGRTWAWVGGALAGTGVSALVSAAVAGIAGLGIQAMVLASWLGCWALALTLRSPQRENTGEGWGR